MITVEFAGTSLIATPRGLIAQALADEETVLEANLSVQDIMRLRQTNVHDDTWWGLGLRQPKAYLALQQDYVGLNRNLAEEIAQRMSQTTPSSTTLQ